MRTPLLLSLCTLALAGCPKPRTSAATQPTPAAFDPAQSDPAAVAVVDAGVAALGGADKWTNLKQLRFTIAYKQDGQTKARFEHAWDRWNGRHYFVTADQATVGGKPEDVKYIEVRYDLFDKDAVPSASQGGKAAMRADAAKLAGDARRHLDQDLYMLAIIYKLKDPGVRLAVDNAEVVVPDSEVCKPSCTSVKVTFDPAVGKDTWYVSFNNETKLPQVIEMQKGAGRIGYELQGWVDAGGLKWPTRLQNLGYKGEVIELGDIRVGEPEEELYVPAVGH
ncbi:MAG TPA: hypothetical protein VM734_02925 [Kofleriaceae bacterium]|jgi:hypothetical protein|nr:hypothetical protein [Kofleriaceae bacterium]